MRRREFIAGVSSATAVMPFVAQAQAGMPVVGFLNTRMAGADPHLLAAFHNGLKQTGFIENQNFGVEYRWAENRNDRLPELAADLVRHRVTVIATGGVPATQALRS